MSGEVCRVLKISNGFIVSGKRAVKRPPSSATIIDGQVHGTSSIGLRPYILKDRSVFVSTVEQLKVEVGEAIRDEAEATRLLSDGALEADPGPAAPLKPGREKKKGEGA